MAWDFINRPELPNSQMDFYYFESPHKQIFEDFTAKVIRVKDGDTIQVTWQERDFDFPVRLLDIDAPEISAGGRVAKNWLRREIEGKFVDIIIDRTNRVGKWGRILGKVMSEGMDMGQRMIDSGFATPFERRREGEIPDALEIMEAKHGITATP